MVKVTDEKGEVYMTLDEILETYNVTEEELEKLVKEGKIRTKTFKTKTSRNN